MPRHKVSSKDDVTSTEFKEYVRFIESKKKRKR